MGRKPQTTAPPPGTRIKLRSPEGLAWMRRQGRGRALEPDYRVAAQEREQREVNAVRRMRKAKPGIPLADAIDALYPVDTLERSVIERDGPSGSMEARVRLLLLAQAERRSVGEPYRRVCIAKRALRTIGLGRGALPCRWSDSSLVRWAS